MWTRDSSRALPRRLAVIVLCLVSVSGPNVLPQAVSNPNQIFGRVELTNIDPAVLAILGGSSDSPPGAGKGFSSGSLRADSIGTSPTFNNATAVTVTSGTTATYELTVEGSTAGIPYRLYHVHPAAGAERSMRLDGGGDIYLFAGQTSSPVFPEPAPDVELDFAECAGIVEVHFRDQDGTPVTVDGGSIIARRQPEDVIQAQDFELPAGTTTETLAVRGDGSEVQIDVTFSRTVGTDAFLDLIRFEGSCQKLLTVQCDEIQVVECEVPFDAEGGVDPQDLGEITGQFDILGEEEHFTLWFGDSGPFNNRRIATVNDTPPLPPANGTFRLPNLLRSDFVSPPREYQVYGLTSFRLGNAYHYVETPFLGRAPNPGVLAEGGTVTDLGDTFVMNPGFLDVDILLAGPPVGMHGSCLEDIARDSDFDTDGDGLPADWGISGFSRLEAWSTGLVADGAVFSNSRANTRVSFDGSFDPGTDSFVGDSQMVLAALAQEPAIWRANQLKLRFLDTETSSTPEDYQDSTLILTNSTLPDFELEPGEHIPVDHHYCFGEVRVTFGSSSGTFFNPRLSSPPFGFFAGPDFEGNPANYSVRVNAGGTPVDEATASGQGLVAFCAPAATYTLTPSVTSVDPGGGTSDTELPPITFTCGCRQLCVLTPEIQISLDPVAECTADGTLPISGSVSSDVDVARIFYSTGGGEVDICPDNCGVDPSFQAIAALSACENEVTVTAVDVLGNEASVTSTVISDAQPPVLSGCEAISVDVDSGETEAQVVFNVSATDDCSGPVSVDCDPPSGSFFPVGETEVTCSTVDGCGGAGQCVFPVTVTSCQPAEPDVRTRGFWKRQCQGAHPSGEHDNLPGYVEAVNGYQTFSGVGDVMGLCDRLNPRPRNDKCEKAEAQLMAAALNVASERLAPCNCIDDPNHDGATVGEVLADLDALLSNPDRSFSDCNRVKKIAGRLNTGDSDCETGSDEDSDSDSDSGSDSDSDSDSDSG